jgi:ligand-binding sensor domain-containing protein
MKIVMLHVPIVAIRERQDSSVEVETLDRVLRFDAHSMELISNDPDAAGGNRVPKRTSLSTGDSIKDNAFVCAECGPLGITSSLLQRANLDRDQIRMAMHDHDGNVWIATRESGVFRVAKRSNDSSSAAPEIDRLSVHEGLSSDSVWDIFEDREHNLWVATQNGLNRLRDDKFSIVTRRTGLLSNDISSLVSAEGGVFAGSNIGLHRVTTRYSESRLHGSFFACAPATGPFFCDVAGTVATQGKGKARLVPLGVDVTHIRSFCKAPLASWFCDQDDFLSMAGGAYRKSSH